MDVLLFQFSRLNISSAFDSSDITWWSVGTLDPEVTSSGRVHNAAVYYSARPNPRVKIRLAKQCKCGRCIMVLQDDYIFSIRGLLKKYPDWNCSGCSLGGMCLQPVLTCSYMS